MSLSPRARWISVAALYVGLTLAYSRTLLPVIGSALPNDAGDPGLNAWILWWNAHAVPLTRAWWNAPMFSPAEGAFALSETFLNLWPLSTPMQWAGASAVLTYNVMFLLSFPAAALAAHVLARHLTGRHDAALIAGLAFGFAPYRAAQMPHLQALWSCWMPLALFCLHRFLDTRSRRALALFGVCWLMNALSTGYYLFFFSALAALWVLWFARHVRDYVAIGAATAIATLPLVPLLLGYRHYQSAFGVTRTLAEIRFFSADLSEVWAAHPYVLPRLWTLTPQAEGELYPGATILALVLLGGMLVWWRARPRRAFVGPLLVGLAGLASFAAVQSWLLGGRVVTLLGTRISMRRPERVAYIALALIAAALAWNPRVLDAVRRRSASVFYPAAALLMLLLALGPEARLFDKPFWSPAPYAWLMELPGGHALRVPARFSMLFALCLSIAAALAFRRMTPRGAHLAIAVPIVLAVGLEGFVGKMELGRVPAPLELGGLGRGAIMLELPTPDDFTDTAAMLRATQGGWGLVNGFSGYWPPHYRPLKEGLHSVDGEVIEALRQFHPLLVFINSETGRNERWREMVAALPGAERLLTKRDGTLYRLPARPPEPRPPDAVVQVSDVRSNLDASSITAVVDGDLETTWHTSTSQMAGNEIAITLDRPMTVLRIELDLGRAHSEYPRKLQITVSDGGSDPVVVWDRWTMGPVILAALSDPRRIPISLDLAPQVRGQRIVLRVSEDYEIYPWSIAELRVFGR